MIASDFATGIIEAFEAGEVAPGEFDHRAHVRLAWCYLERYPLLAAATRFVTALRGFTKRVGAEAKYHETVTLAFLLLIAERKTPGQSWSAFEASQSDVIESGSALLRDYYSEAVLEDPTAKQFFRWPDRRRWITKHQRSGDESAAVL